MKNEAGAYRGDATWVVSTLPRGKGKKGWEECRDADGDPENRTLLTLPLPLREPVLQH
jgi:hypothetical protein